MRAALALVAHTWATWFQYKGFFFLLAFGWMTQPLIFLFVWSNAATFGAIGGYARGDFVAYYLVLIVVNQLTFAQTNWTVGDLIRDGTMNTILLRPIAPIVDTAAAEIAGKVVFLSFAIPVAGLLLLVLSPADVLAGRSVAVRDHAARRLGSGFLWGYWLALTAFWSTRSHALVLMQDALVFVLAGQIAPISLLPGGLRTAAEWLPFRYMLGFPIEVLLGRVPEGALTRGIILQLVWLTVAGGLAYSLWRLGVRRHAAVGG